MPIIRLPLSQPIESRTASFAKDSRSVNGYFETRDQSKREFIKRPGLIAPEITPPLEAAEAQGLTKYEDSLFAVTNNTVYEINPTAYTSSVIGTITGALNNCYFTSMLNDAYMFFHNKVNGYLVSKGSHTITQITNDTVATTSVVVGGSNYSDNATVVFSAPDTGTTTTGTLNLTSGIVTGVTLTNSGSGYGTPPTVTVKPYMVVSDVTVTNTSGTPTLTAASLSDTVYIGMSVEGTGIPTGTVVNNITGTGPYTITLNKNTTSAVTLVTFSGISNVGVTNTSGTTILTTSLASATLASRICVGMSVTGTGIQANTKVTEIAFNGTSTYTITLSLPTTSIATQVTFKDEGNGAVITAALNYFPTDLVPGIVFLDSYVFVGTKSGRLYASNLANPAIWNPLDYLTAEAEPDNLVGITKHFNYIIGFGQWSTEFFYDAGNASGSPLAPAPAYRMEIGCANGDSIVQFEQSVIWIGKSKSEGTQVFMLEGTSPIKVSTTYIDRWLKASTLEDVKAYVFKMNGHTFYVMTLHDLNVSLVYDVNEKVWYQWTSYAPGDESEGQSTAYAEQYFRPSYFVGYGGEYWALDDDTGVLYKISSSYYDDAGAPIFYRSVTDIMDSGTTKRKFYNRLEIVGDKVPATMMIRHSDNDYQTWSSYRQVDLSKVRPQIYQQGSARRRAWEFLCTESQPLRLDAAEIDFDIGEMEQDAVAPPTYRR